MLGLTTVKNDTIKLSEEAHIVCIFIICQNKAVNDTFSDNALLLVSTPKAVAEAMLSPG